MNYQPLRHRSLWLVLLGIGLIILLGLWFGPGYVLLVWLGWQVQTSATVLLLLLFALFMALLYLVRAGSRWINNRHLHHPEKIEHYQQLQPFEQLGCLWLLNAKTSKAAEIEAIFNQSAHLRPLVKAHLLRENAQLQQAAQALNQGSALSDLLQLEQIALQLAGQQYAAAQAALTALRQQPVSAFAQSLNPAWDESVQCLWAALLTAQPWLLLEMEGAPALTPDQQCKWLGALQQQLAPATAQQLQQLIGFYQRLQAQPEFWQNMACVRQWLFVLHQVTAQTLPLQQQQNLIQQRQQLADQLLRMEFDPRILTIWLQNQLQEGNVECQHFTRRLNELAQRYPGQPCIALAQWHQLTAEQQTEAAQEILQSWPQHPDFGYLRLSQALASQPELLADLKRLYQAQGQLDNQANSKTPPAGYHANSAQ